MRPRATTPERGGPIEREEYSWMRSRGGEELVEIVVARLRARQRPARVLSRGVVLDEEVLHPRLLRVREDRLEVDRALPHRRHSLLGAGDHHVLDVPHREATRILREQGEG